MFHHTGENIIAINEEGLSHARSGFGLIGGGTHQTTLLEEGLATYEASTFCDNLISQFPDQFENEKKEFGKKQEIISELQEKGVIVEGKLTLRNAISGFAMEINPKYTGLELGSNSHPDDIIVSNYSLAAELIERMINKVPENERYSFLKTMFVARINPKQIPEFAKKIDNYFGKGTYIKILKCPQDDQSVWKLIQHIESK
jgi:hypothetical protein